MCWHITLIFTSCVLLNPYMAEYYATLSASNNYCKRNAQTCYAKKILPVFVPLSGPKQERSARKKALQSCDAVITTPSCVTSESHSRLSLSRNRVKHYSPRPSCERPVSCEGRRFWNGISIKPREWRSKKETVDQISSWYVWRIKHWVRQHREGDVCSVQILVKVWH